MLTVVCRTFRPIARLAPIVILLASNLTTAQAETQNDWLPTTGTEIRILVQDSVDVRWIEGRLSAVSRDSLMLTGNDFNETIATKQMLRLQKRRLPDPDYSRVVGAGFVLGGISGALAYRSQCRRGSKISDRLVECGDLIGPFTAGAAAIGSALGSIVARRLAGEWVDISVAWTPESRIYLRLALTTD